LEIERSDKSPRFKSMRVKLPRGTLDKLWSDQASWQVLGIYYCKNDPRVVVPKIYKWGGWTINFAHPSWWWAGSIPIVVLVVPVISVIYFTKSDPGHLFVPVIAVSIILCCAVCWFMSSPKRYELND
jgi:hypothetical protein